MSPISFLSSAIRLAEGANPYIIGSALTVDIPNDEERAQTAHKISRMVNAGLLFSLPLVMVALSLKLLQAQKQKTFFDQVATDRDFAQSIFATQEIQVEEKDRDQVLNQFQLQAKASSTHLQGQLQFLQNPWVFAMQTITVLQQSVSRFMNPLVEVGTRWSILQGCQKSIGNDTLSQKIGAVFSASLGFAAYNFIKQMVITNGEAPFSKRQFSADFGWAAFCSSIDFMSESVIPSLMMESVKERLISVNQ